MRNSLLALAFVAALGSLSRAAQAEWLAGGNPVCTATGAQSNARCAPDGFGGAVLLWTDERRGSGLIDLYGTRILGDGALAPGWPAGGTAIATSGNATSWSLVGDGDGGLIAFWLNGTTHEPCMQHVLGSGAFAPGFALGGKVLPIAVGASNGFIFVGVSDDAGGAYLMWNHSDGTTDAVEVSRVDGTGSFALGWTPAGVEQVAADPFTSIAAVGFGPDPSGGAVTCAIYPSGGQGVGTLTRTGPNGDGIALRAGLSNPPAPGIPMTLVADSAGGAFVTWYTGPTRRVQHILADSTSAMPDPTVVPVFDGIYRDGNGGIYLFGRPDQLSHLELHRRASDGSIPPPWTAAGVVVSDAGPFLSYSSALSGGLVYAAWTVGNAGAYDVRAAAVTADGALAPGWPLNGIAVSDAPNDQVLTSVMAMPPTDALAVWADVRDGEPDVYALRLTPTGRPSVGVSHRPVAFALALAPNPAGDRARASFTLPETGAAALEIVDVAGRVRAHLDAEPQSGPQSLALATARLPGGCYWARLRQGVHVTVQRFAVVH
jgi:hypothetical protein